MNGRYQSGLELSKTAARRAAIDSLRIREEDPEKGGRQANSVFIQQVRMGGILKEAQNMRELIPSRSIRAGMKNSKAQ